MPAIRSTIAGVRRIRVSRGSAAGVELLEVLVRVERCHAARAGRRDRLAVDVVGDVARCEYAWHAGRRRHTAAAAADDDVALFHLELTVEDRGVRGMSDRDEDTGDRDLAWL